jgi:hypothetical protein
MDWAATLPAAEHFGAWHIHAREGGSLIVRSNKTYHSAHGACVAHDLSLSIASIAAESIARLQRRVQAYIDNHFQPDTVDRLLASSAAFAHPLVEADMPVLASLVEWVLQQPTRPGCGSWSMGCKVARNKAKSTLIRITSTRRNRSDDSLGPTTVEAEALWSLGLVGIKDTFLKKINTVLKRDRDGEQDGPAGGSDDGDAGRRSTKAARPDDGGSGGPGAVAATSCGTQQQQQQQQQQAGAGPSSSASGGGATATAAPVIDLTGDDGGGGGGGPSSAAAGGSGTAGQAAKAKGKGKQAAKGKGKQASKGKKADPLPVGQKTIASFFSKKL